VPPKLVKIAITQSAPLAAGSKTWAVVKKAGNVIVEATTAPNNNADEWKLIQWSGDSGDAVQGFLNRRKLSLATSRKFHVEAKIGQTGDSLDLWVLWATVEILTKKQARPGNAAPFDKGSRDNTQDLGAVTYESFSSTVIDENAGIFVTNMGASGKITAVATLSPKGVNQVVKTGWALKREVWSENYLDGARDDKTSNSTWTPDISKPVYLKLTPDSDDKLYDTDAPDLRWGQFSSETNNRFRQWVEWNGEKCSDQAYWHWKAQWVAPRDDKSKQIVVNDLASVDMTLPGKSAFPKGRVP